MKEKKMKQKILPIVVSATLFSSALLLPTTSFAEKLTKPSVSVTSENSQSKNETVESSITTSETHQSTESGSSSTSTPSSSTTSSQETESSSSNGGISNHLPAEKPVIPSKEQQSKKESKTTNTVPVIEDKKEGKPVLEHTTIPNLDKIVVTKNQTTEEFIKKIGESARQVAHQYDLYASVMIAQAILESGSGNSGLASEPNYNLFGIKGEYDGASIVMKTQEDNGKGNLYTIDSAFRKYPSYKESLEDYAKLLKEGLTGNKDYYHGTWKSQTTSYKEATHFLMGRYATDTQYAEKLNQLIDVYNLTAYDEWHEENDAAAQAAHATPMAIKKAAEEKKAEQKKKEKHMDTVKAATKALNNRMEQIKKRKEERTKTFLTQPQQFLFQLLINKNDKNT